MKFDPLITQFLQDKKRLSLPGIGTFFQEAGSIRFENLSDKEISTDFIEFVKANTGKMSSLAKSDIESYIMLNRQFLNIGKHMHIEGVGTLVKSREGSLEYTPGLFTIEKMGESDLESRPSAAFSEDLRYQSRASQQRKLVFVLLGLLTIGIIAAGAWYMTNNNGTEPKETAVAEPQPATVPQTTDSISLKPADSLASSAAPVAAIDNGIAEWDFVILQTANKANANRRFTQLKELGDKVKMDNRDSLLYRVYFRLPALAADTIRKRDSLSRFYGARVRVQKP